MDASTEFERVGPDPERDDQPDGRSKWVALLIVVPLLVLVGLLLTGGERLQRSAEELAGFEIQTTSTTQTLAADLTTGWSSAQLDTWGAFVDVAEHAGRLIAVEQSPFGSQLWVSDGGSAWNPVPGTSALFETASLESITRVAEGWIAAGSDRSDRMHPPLPTIWYSNDGEEWSQAQPLPTGTAEGIDGYEGGTVLTVAEVTNGLLLAGGTSNNGAAIWTSADGGLGWQLAFREGVFSTIRGLVETEGGYLAIGQRTLLAGTWRSTNGTDWLRDEPSALTAAVSREYAWDVFKLDGGWLALGGLVFDRFHELKEEEVERPPVVWSSSDGETWDRDLLDELVGVDFAESVALGGRIVAVGSRTVDGERRAGVWWSDDSRNWQSSMLEPRGSVASQVGGIVGYGDRLVAVGQSDSGPCVWVWDADGPVSIETSHRSEFAAGRWVDRGIVFDQPLRDVSRTEHGLVASGEQGLAVSADAREWSLRSFEEMGITQPSWISSLPSGGPPYFMALWSEPDRWWVARSVDGESWQVALDSAESGSWGWGLLASGGGGVFVAGEGPEGRSMLLSADGETWEPVSPPSDGFPGAIFGFGDDFFVSMVPEWDNAAGALWKYTPSGDWVEISEIGDFDAYGLESFVFEGEFYLFQRWPPYRVLQATVDGIGWRDVELPKTWVGSELSIEPTAAGLMLVETLWDEDQSLTARIWMLPPTGQWIALPPIGFAGFEILPIPGSASPSLLSTEGFGQTRLWEWVEG